MSALPQAWLFAHRVVTLLAFCGLALFLAPAQSGHAGHDVAAASSSAPHLK